MSSYGKWYFTTEQLSNSPSRKHTVDEDTEIRYKQEAAMYIQAFGDKVKLSQLCINTAIVYMHRFYVYHSFKNFHRHAIAATVLWFASKIEEQPRSLETIIRVAFTDLLHAVESSAITNSDIYIKLERDMLMNENILIQTLGFQFTIDHPHTHIFTCCEMIKASSDIVKWSVIIANNSLHLTSMCLKYPPRIIACFCIYFVCKWSSIQIPVSEEGNPWFSYIDKTVTEDLLQNMITEYLDVYDRCNRSCLKQRIASVNKSSGAPATPDSGYESPKLPTLDEDLYCSKKKMAIAKVFRVKKMKIYAKT